MKTTIDLPDDLMNRARLVAVQRRTTFKELVKAGLDCVLRPEATPTDPKIALKRLQDGMHLGGRPLTRDQVHERP